MKFIFVVLLSCFLINSAIGNLCAANGEANCECGTSAAACDATHYCADFSASVGVCLIACANNGDKGCSCGLDFVTCSAGASCGDV